MNPFAIAAILFAIAAAAYVFYKIQYTKKNGIEAEAVITRIEEEGIGSDTSYNYFVRYTMNGQSVEAKLSNPGFGKGLEVGAQIRIKTNRKGHSGIAASAQVAELLTPSCANPHMTQDNMQTQIVRDHRTCGCVFFFAQGRRRISHTKPDDTEYQRHRPEAVRIIVFSKKLKAKSEVSFGSEKETHQPQRHPGARDRSCRQGPAAGYSRVLRK